MTQCVYNTLYMYTYCICLTSAYGEILCIWKICHRYQKRFKVHFFQCEIGVYHKLNEEIVMHSAGHRKFINNIKHSVRILLKLLTKKILQNHTSKISKEKIFPLWAVSYRMENHFYRIKRPPLNVTIFITHVRNLRNGCYANALLKHG